MCANGTRGTTNRPRGRSSLYEAFLKVGVTNCDTVAQKKSKSATLRGESHDVPGRLLQKVSLVDVDQEQSDY